MCAAVSAALLSNPEPGIVNAGNSNEILNENLATTSTSASIHANAAVSGAIGGASNSSSSGGSSIIQKSAAICRYYVRGICRFGSMCRFSHDAIGGEISSIDENDSSTAETAAAEATEGETEAESAAATASTSAAAKDKKLIDWANAPAFVPSGKIFIRTNIDDNDNNNNDIDDDEISDENVGNKTWAEIVGGDNNSIDAAASGYIQFSAPGSVEMLCPYQNPCPYGDYCAYQLHLELCKMCDMYVLHPNDMEQRRQHNQECLQQHEKDMELSFAIARSRDKTCGICMDIIMEKTGREKRFGILPNCTHIFCLECIRKWRQAKQFEHKITRSCPECRIASDFVCPSAYWVETKEEKDKLLNDYRAALGVKDCKYFGKGNGKCPFGNKCFYKHALANGELVDVGCPRRSRKLLRQTNEIINLLDIYLWEFVDHRDLNFLDLLSNTSDDSDFDD